MSLNDLPEKSKSETTTCSSIQEPISENSKCESEPAQPFTTLLKDHYEKNKNANSTSVVKQKQKIFKGLLKRLAYCVKVDDCKNFLFNLRWLVIYLDKEEYLDELNLRSYDVSSLKMTYIICSYFGGGRSLQELRKQNSMEMANKQNPFFRFFKEFMRCEGQDEINKSFNKFTVIIPETTENYVQTDEAGIANISTQTEEDPNATITDLQRMLSELREENAQLKSEIKNNNAVMMKTLSSAINNQTFTSKKILLEIEELKQNKKIQKKSENLPNQLKDSTITLKREINSGIGKVLDKITVFDERKRKRVYQDDEVYNLLRKCYEFQTNVYQFFERQYEFSISYLRSLGPEYSSRLDNLSNSLANLEMRLREVQISKNELHQLGRSFGPGLTSQVMENWPFHPIIEELFEGDVIYDNFPIVCQFASVLQQGILDVERERACLEQALHERNSIPPDAGPSRSTGAVRKGSQQSQESSPSKEVPDSTSSDASSEPPPNEPWDSMTHTLVLHKIKKKIPSVSDSKLNEAVVEVQEMNKCSIEVISMDDVERQILEIIENELSCTICLTLDDVPLMSIPCGHMFHEKCIKEWRKINRTCPVCRNPSV